MAFENRTNEVRVRKMLETLDLIEKSAKSNKASEMAIGFALEPVFRRLLQMAPGLQSGAVATEQPATAPEAAARGRTGVTAPQWASVRDMAQEASLSDLTYAMAVYINRIDEHLGKSRE